MSLLGGTGFHTRLQCSEPHSWYLHLLEIKPTIPLTLVLQFELQSMLHLRTI